MKPLSRLLAAAAIPALVLGVNVYFLLTLKLVGDPVAVLMKAFLAINVLYFGAYLFLVLFIFPIPKERRKRKLPPNRKVKRIAPPVLPGVPDPRLLPHQRGYPKWMPAVPR